MLCPAMFHRTLLICFVVSAIALTSCSSTAVQIAADTLSASGRSTVFTGDEDPELVRDSLPLLLKAHEILLEQVPTHESLAVQTGSLTVMYANAFVQGPAEMMGTEQSSLKRAALDRALKLYLRADRVLRPLVDRKFPGLGASLDKAKKEDVPLLYWESAAVMSAVALSPYDLNLSVRIKDIRALLARAYQLDPDWGNGTLDEIYISVYASLPASLGGDRALAKHHFDEAVRKEAGKGTGPYVAYATAVCLPDQDLATFQKLMNEALAVDVNAAPELRLANTLNQRKASWYLAHQDDLFL
jgi:predicted anti-sigma-YlaC factor YlaD